MGRRKNFFSPAAEPETVETQADEVVESAAGVAAEVPAAEPETVETGLVGDDVVVESVEELQAASAAAPDTATDDPAAPIDVLSNPGRNVMRIGGIVIAPGGTRKLTDKDRADELSMKKIEHMVKLGVLHRGAD